MLKIISTEKLPFEQAKGIRKGFYLKGDDYIYYSKNKGSRYKSVELLADRLVNTNSLLVWDDIDNQVVYIVYCNQIRPTIEIDLKDEFFTWDKLNSILMLSILYTNNKDIYIPETSKIIDKIDFTQDERKKLEELKDQDINIYKEYLSKIDKIGTRCNVKKVKKTDFLSAYKKSYTLKSQSYYIARSSIVIVVLLFIVIGSNIAFKKYEQNFKKTINEEVAKIVGEKKEIQEEIRQLNEELKISENIAKDLKIDLKRVKKDAN